MIVVWAIIIFIGSIAAINGHYGHRPAFMAFILAVIFGCAGSQSVRLFFDLNEPYEYDEEAVYPAEEWRRVLTISKQLEGFDYHPEQGLFLLTKRGRIQLTETIPGCLRDGGIAISYGNSRSRQPIRDVLWSKIALPQPPGKPLQQIYFDIPIQDRADVDTVILGASGYAVYDNGEVWCTERKVQRGQAVGVALAFAGSAPYFSMFLIFALTLPVSAVVIGLILRHRQKRA